MRQFWDNFSETFWKIYFNYLCNMNYLMGHFEWYISMRHFEWTFWVRHFEWAIFCEIILRKILEIFFETFRVRHVLWDTSLRQFEWDIFSEIFWMGHFEWDILYETCELWNIFYETFSVRHFELDLRHERVMFWFRTKLLVTLEILVLLYSSLCDFSEFQCKNCCKTHKTVSGGKGVTNQCLFFLSVAHLFQSWKKQKKER